MNNTMASPPYKVDLCDNTLSWYAVCNLAVTPLHCFRTNPTRPSLDLHPSARKVNIVRYIEVDRFRSVQSSTECGSR